MNNNNYLCIDFNDLEEKFMKICSNCGHENEDNAKFCVSCGNNVQTLAPSDTHIDFEPDDILPENFTSPDIIWKTIQTYGVNE